MARIAITDRDVALWPRDACYLHTDALARQNRYPIDSEVRFDEGPHKYYIGNSDVPIRLSVTGVVHGLFEKFDSEKKVQEMNPEKKAKEYAGLTDDEIVELWKSRGKEASESGTRMHAAIETFFNTYNLAIRQGFITADPKLSVEMAMFKGWLRDEFDQRCLIPVRTEMIIHGGGTAGSIDFLAKSYKTGEYYILDWKRIKEVNATCNGHFGYSTAPFLSAYNLENVNLVHYSLQLHVYRYMLMKYCGFPDIPVRNLYLVVFHPNNDGYRMVQCRDYSHIVPIIFANMDKIEAH